MQKSLGRKWPCQPRLRLTTGRCFRLTHRAHLRSVLSSWGRGLCSPLRKLRAETTWVASSSSGSGSLTPAIGRLPHSSLASSYFSLYIFTSFRGLHMMAVVLAKKLGLPISLAFTRMRWGHEVLSPRMECDFNCFLYFY